MNSSNDKKNHIFLLEEKRLEKKKLRKKRDKGIRKWNNDLFSMVYVFFGIY